MDGKRFPNGIVAVEKQKANLNGADLYRANLTCEFDWCEFERYEFAWCGFEWSESRWFKI